MSSNICFTNYFNNNNMFSFNNIFWMEKMTWEGHHHRVGGGMC